MVAVAQGWTVDAARPVLTFHNVLTGTAVAAQGPDGRGCAGSLAEPHALSWAVYDCSTDERRGSPVQTHPPTSVDLVADRVSPGVYAADWDVPADEPLGLHELRWTLTATPSSAPATYRREFDVLRSVAGLGQLGYALVSDLRSEGFGPDRVSDARLQLLIEQWSRMVDRWTRRFFEPRSLTLLLDGHHASTLNLGVPVVGVSDVAMVDDSGSPNPVDLTGLRVYNRHLTEGMTQPDDREAPRLEFVLLQPVLVGMGGSYYSAGALRSGGWPRGTQNVRVAGSFGYTDPDGSPSGVTPALVRRAVQLLVVRNLPRLSQTNARFDALHHHRITTESTRGQSYNLAAGRAGKGDYTGDDEIDSILDQYSSPIQMAST